VGSRVNTETTAINRPQTFGVQDQGILAADSRVDITRNLSQITNRTEIDEGAVSSAFDFARGAFSDATSTVEKSLALAGLINQPMKQESIRTIAGSPLRSSIGGNLPMILLVGAAALFMFFKARR